MLSGLAEIGEPLEGADADVAVLEPDQHRRPGRGGLVVALERLAGLDQREGLGGLDAERLEHLGRQHLADAALERQPAVADAAIGRLARALGAEIEQAAGPVAQLREQEPAPVADIRIVNSELVAVIAQRQRLRQIVRERVKAAEVADPLLLAEISRARRPAPSGRCGTSGSSVGSRRPRPDRKRHLQGKVWESPGR